MVFLAYTIFEDAACTQVRSVYETEDGYGLVEVFRFVKGSEPQVGDIIAGCRIDRLGSKQPPV